MNFIEFEHIISKIETSKLGGLEAQFKLAPRLRLQYNEEFIANANPKKAAVLALFYPNYLNETCFLLTLRASYKGVHSAQISFPGGKFEKEDTTLEKTALRETNEEVGINSKYIKVFKEVTDVYIPPSNFLVTPYLGVTLKQPNFIKNEEVETLIEVKLSDLLNSNSITTTNVTTSYMQKVEVPCFKLNKYIVWGATAMMLSEIRELFKSV
ncbi:CoA pyrophosphatase [Lutibacter sp. TH_r2]|uniref:NUDIX hydrolase n=1 Tax=Lutibacter sp. TH_r2 TaxID=3082083 RepID=UPI0029547FDC|nr:CoA pyrophosphatase [Lutibacter sp. TH_r2]MDV7188145.1 CoA pyrophosphatase [Lutibacter sp. TH_r2]